MADQSFTITEWCKLRRYSRAEFYRMKARGEAPDLIGAGRATRITPGADERWLAAMEAKFANGDNCPASKKRAEARPST